MNFRITLLFLLLLVGSPCPAFSGETPIVAVIAPEPVIVARGQSAAVPIRAKIQKGFHIQANPAADEFLIPTTLTLEASTGIVTGTPMYPAGVPYRLEGGTRDLLTYEEEVTITLPIKVTDSAPLGKNSLSGRLRFQPCDARRCLFPRAIPVSIPFNIVASP